MKLSDNTQCRYLPDAGTHGSDEVICCGVCGHEMNCTPNQYGPTSSIAAIANRLYGGERGKRHYDLYICRFTDDKWHQQAVEIHKEAEQTKSQWFRSNLLKEAKEIIDSRKPTL